LTWSQVIRVKAKRGATILGTAALVSLALLATYPSGVIAGLLLLNFILLAVCSELASQRSVDDRQNTEARGIDVISADGDDGEKYRLREGAGAAGRVQDG
jgi:type III secretory pathway component EscV